VTGGAKTHAAAVAPVNHDHGQVLRTDGLRPAFDELVVVVPVPDVAVRAERDHPAAAGAVGEVPDVPGHRGPPGQVGDTDQRAGAPDAVDVPADRVHSEQFGMV
jgi:hypothetical protein